MVKSVDKNPENIYIYIYEGGEERKGEKGREREKRKKIQGIAFYHLDNISSLVNSILTDFSA